MELVVKIFDTPTAYADDTPSVVIYDVEECTIHGDACVVSRINGDSVSFPTTLIIAFAGIK